MKLGIVGSRTFNNYDFLKKCLSFHDDISLIISGGAKGADSLAIDYAKEHRIKYIEFLPNWDMEGRSAGFNRNKRIVEAVDEIIAFWDGSSKGSKHTIDLAESVGKLVYIYWPSANEVIESIGL
mgnify:FL=1